MRTSTLDDIGSPDAPEGSRDWAMWAAAKAKPLAKHGGERVSDEQADNISLIPQHGTSTDYTLRRLARDGFNELLDAIESGEMSVNAAAIKAGFRKVKTPLEQLNHWWEKASADEQDEFMNLRANRSRQ